jgi:hypothetical protein
MKLNQNTVGALHTEALVNYFTFASLTGERFAATISPVPTS